MNAVPACLTYDLFVRATGVLFLLDWLAFLPFFSIAFRRDERRPFGPADRARGRALALLWLGAALAIIFGGAAPRLTGLLALFAIFRHYFIRLRWTSIRRGFGAPGFMAHWTVFYLLLLETGCRLDAGGPLPAALFTLMRFDFALIILCAGAYKMLAGYWQNAGMEYGQVNPMWGYFWTFFRRINPFSLPQRAMNILASGIELAAGAMMLTPIALGQLAGAALVSLSFLYIACIIRLGRLALLMVVLPFIFLPGMPGSFLHDARPVVQPLLAPGLVAAGVLAVKLLMVLLVAVKVVQYVNFFGNRKLPAPWQQAFTWFANFWPIIIWRVFTVDVTNFFVRIYRATPGGDEAPVLHETGLYDYRDWNHLRLKLRFLHVSESIALTSVFTTLKYFSSKPELFREKLLRYAQSILPMLPEPATLLRFEYVSIRKTPVEFIFVPVGHFTVDLAAGAVTETKYVADYDYSRPADHSPVRESSGPGAYTRKGL